MLLDQGRSDEACTSWKRNLLGSCPQTDEKETDLEEGPGKDLEGARPLTAL